MPTSPRSRSAALLTLAALIVVSGCSGDAESATDDGKPLAEPVTVEHRFGTTTIDAVPERIVAIDLQWTDTMLAMGVEPIAYSVDAYMPDPEVPWQDLPDDATALNMEDGVPIDKILSLDPDLVVASFSISDQETYDLLSARVPTIAGPPSATAVTPWPELVRTAGQILDQPDRAEEVISSVEQEIRDTAAQLPELSGKTFALAQYIVGDSMTIVADEEDGSSELFQQLGMRLYPPLVSEGEESGDARISVSTERADLLRADLLAFLINGGDESDLADIPGFDQLPGTIAVLDYTTVVGINTPSPLSIPYALDALRPYLEDTAAATP
jgi:iron complex transport system substrate-binding protein